MPPRWATHFWRKLSRSPPVASIAADGPTVPEESAETGLDNPFLNAINPIILNFMKLDRIGNFRGWIDWLYLLRARWPVVFLATSVALLGGAALRARIPALYEAVARISFADGERDEGGGAAREATGFRSARASDFGREAAELGSRSLLSEVVTASGLAERWGCADEAEAMRRLGARYRIESDPAERSFAIRVRDLSREEAAGLANLAADRFLERKEAEVKGEANARVHRLEAEAKARLAEIAEVERRLVGRGVADTEAAAVSPVEPGEQTAEGNEGEEDLRRQLVSLRNLVHSLEAKRQLAAIEAREARSPFRLVAPASPERSRPVSRGLLALPSLLLIGAAGGVAAVLLWQGRRSRWSALADLMERLEASVVGFAPISGRSWVGEERLPDPVAEPYREVRNRLVRLPAGECLFLAVMPQRGGSASAEAVANLACVLADGGKTVLAIDADFRQAALHEPFEAARHPGLVDYLSGEMRLEETVLRSRRANLWFMPAGSDHADPGGLLIGRRMGDLEWELRSRFDFVIVASPSIHESSDAGVLVGMADYTLVTTAYPGHSLRRLRETKTALETVSATFAGVLLTTRVEAESAVPKKAPGRSLPESSPTT